MHQTVYTIHGFRNISFSRLVSEVTRHLPGKLSVTTLKTCVINDWC